MLHPVSITHRQNRYDWNGEKDTCDAGEFFTRENRENHREWMKVNALSD